MICRNCNRVDTNSTTCDIYLVCRCETRHVGDDTIEVSKEIEETLDRIENGTYNYVGEKPHVIGHTFKDYGMDG